MPIFEAYDIAYEIDSTDSDVELPTTFPIDAADAAEALDVAADLISDETGFLVRDLKIRLADDD